MLLIRSKLLDPNLAEHLRQLLLRSAERLLNKSIIDVEYGRKYNIAADDKGIPKMGRILKIAITALIKLTSWIE